MATSLYLASLGPHSGKSVVSLGVMELLSSRVDRLGYFRPIVPDGDDEDVRIALMRSRYDVDRPGLALHALTDPEAQELLAAGQEDELFTRVLTAYRAVAAESDFVLVDGTDFTGVGSAMEFEVNAELATHLSAPVLALVNGRGRTPAEIEGAVVLARESLAAAGCAMAMTVVNRVDPERLDAVRELLADDGGDPARGPVFALPEEPALRMPSLAEVRDALGAKVIRGAAGMGRAVSGYRVAAMALPHYLDHADEGALVITPGDRGDIIVGTVAAGLSAAYPKVAGLLLTGGIAMAPQVAALLKGLDSAAMPVLAVDSDTYTTAQSVAQIPAVLRPDDDRKIATALGVFEGHVDLAVVAERIALTTPTRVTPLMFTYDLIERARAARAHIVLPEGTDDRVLRAAETLRARDVVRLTLLGDEAGVAARIASLGLRLPDVEIIDPATSALRAPFAEAYHELRAHRGVTADAALETMLDVSYFGTMMVHRGLADGMVSGAAHTTAHTIRPSFEIIRTVPGTDTVSSVFLMLLPDRVLVYGDCAVVPNPTAAQLADIAISSAETAMRFGIEPRVAMLSYSTGTSGAGADVEAVREATRLATSRRPDLHIDGPIQYDAAVDVSVGSKKLPESPVAGRATVFVFPDLNTGNNTYKAVQRSSGAVAVGPILQGLNKPVNDLSRGCTVVDIVNTVAITAVQSAGTEEGRGRQDGGGLMRVLAVNSGSSSIKFRLVDLEGRTPQVEGLVERIGEPGGRVVVRGGGPRGREVEVPDHEAGFALVAEVLEEAGVLGALDAFGHRVVHGGAAFTAPTLVDDAVVAAIEALVPLAPLHNPANLIGIEAARALRPDLPHVAVFDTAFHRTMPEAAQVYAIDADLAAAHRIRRYGFHGTSHAWVSRRAAEHLGVEASAFRAITLHLGNGASACAIADGVSVDTSMGLSPLEGLVMGTRSGDLDPAIVFHLIREAGMTPEEVERSLNRRGGLAGLCGVNDMRTVEERIAEGDHTASLAFTVFCRRIRKYVGAYLAVLGRADALVFTGGIGEHSAAVRAAVCEGLDGLGIAVDPARNAEVAGDGETVDRLDPGGPVAVLVVPTDEEREIALQVRAVLTSGA